MKIPTQEEQRAIVRQWKEGSAALRHARDEELRTTPYDWTVVDALLDIGAKNATIDRRTSGLVEMQRLFMELACRRGLIPTATVREAAAKYGSTSATGRSRSAGDPHV